MSILNAVRKGVAAAAGTAAAGLMEEHKAQILAKRDERLNFYDQQNRAANEKFQTTEREAGQKFTMEENDRQRTLTREENEASRKQDQGQFDATLGLRRDELGMERERLDATLEQAEQALATGELELAQKQRIENLYETATSDTATEEQRTRAVENLDVLLNQGGNNYESFTVYGEADPVTGEQPRNTGILNRRTGGREMVTGGSPAGQYNSPDAVRAAFRRNEITREQATELLDQFSQ